MRLTLIALLAAIAATPALADAVTYRGTLGKLPIIAEFSSDPAEPGELFVAHKTGENNICISIFRHPSYVLLTQGIYFASDNKE